MGLARPLKRQSHRVDFSLSNVSLSQIIRAQSHLFRAEAIL